MLEINSFYKIFCFFADSGCLLQPLCTLSQNSNLRVRPEIVLKLASKFQEYLQNRFNRFCFCFSSCTKSLST